jgi:hypothetical protein
MILKRKSVQLGKRQLGRPRRRWVDNIRSQGDRMGWYGLDRSG